MKGGRKINSRSVQYAARVFLKGTCRPLHSRRRGSGNWLIWKLVAEPWFSVLRFKVAFCPFVMLKHIEEELVRLPICPPVGNTTIN